MSASKPLQPLSVSSQNGVLFVVATPIGNLGDISQRALTTLREVDLILAEDCRQTRKLLSAYHITTRVQAHHAHNEQNQTAQLISRLAEGKTVALVSDAGTPLISDPGQWTVAHVREAGFDVVPIPGPCALIAALSAAGMHCREFIFAGFLSTKTGVREQQIQAWQHEVRTVIIYEAPHRIVACLEHLCAVLGDTRDVVIARELTKQFETFIHGTARACLDAVLADDNNQRGEFVVMIAGATCRASEAEARVDVDALLTCLLKVMPVKQAAVEVAALTGLAKNGLYQRALTLPK